MNNFEKACFDSCEKWVNSIEITQEPNYSEKHIKKMNTILHGNKRFFNRKTLIVLVACILMLTFSIVAFAYVGSQTKSKDLIFYSQNPVKIGGFEFGSSINVRVKGANSKNDKLFENLEYGYIPEGYVDLLVDEESDFNKYAWGYENGKYRIFQREFEKYENGEVADRINITKIVESNGINVRNAVYFTEDDKTGDELMDNILSNGIEVVSPDSYELMERVTDFKEDGIHYYFIAPEDENQMGGELYWDYDGYLYILEGYDLPFEELKKIAKDVK